MKLKVIIWYLFNKDKYHTYNILKWIKKAKEYYISRINDPEYKYLNIGMCWALVSTIPFSIKKRYGKITYELLSIVIPEYTPEYFNTEEIDDESNNYGFWWPRNATQSRIEAFDKLIKVYENKLKGI